MNNQKAQFEGVAEDGVGPEQVVDVVDVEEYGKRNERPPKGRCYQIRIDKQKHTVDVPGMTGRQLLLLAGKTPPERYTISQKLHGGQVKTIGLDTYADFTAPGVERFMTLPLDQTEGSPRHQFELPEGDRRFLDSLGMAWDTVIEGGTRWLIVHGRDLPAGYHQGCADVALAIPASYPDAQIDMAYFDPPLSRRDGVPLRSTATQALDGKAWQRWSRHRTGQNPWRPGEDDIAAHLILVDHWLHRELGESRL